MPIPKEQAPKRSREELIEILKIIAPSLSRSPRKRSRNGSRTSKLTVDTRVRIGGVTGRSPKKSYKHIDHQPTTTKCPSNEGGGPNNVAEEATVKLVHEQFPDVGRCSVCGLMYATDVDEDRRLHRARHAKVLRVISPKPQRTLARAYAQRGEFVPIDRSSPLWMRRRLGDIAMQFKRELRFDFAPYYPDDDDPKGHHWLIVTDDGRSIGGLACAGWSSAMRRRNGGGPGSGSFHLNDERDGRPNVGTCSRPGSPASSPIRHSRRRSRVSS